MKKTEQNKYIVRLIFSIIFFTIYWYLPFITRLDEKSSYVFLVLGLVYLCNAIEGIISN